MRKKGVQGWGIVVKDLDGHLYKELMEGLRCGM
jgi:hypothetical protein